MTKKMGPIPLDSGGRPDYNCPINSKGAVAKKPQRPFRVYRGVEIENGIDGEK